MQIRDPDGNVLPRTDTVVVLNPKDNRDPFFSITVGFSILIQSLGFAKAGIYGAVIHLGGEPEVVIPFRVQLNATQD